MSPSGQQVMCRPSSLSPVTSHQSDSGQSNWTSGLSMRGSVCVCLCVCRCVRQAIVNAILQFTFLVFCFCFLFCVFRFTSTSLHIQFRNYSRLERLQLYFSPLDPILLLLHATCHHRNFELSSFFRLQPPIGIHSAGGYDAACLSALFHLSFTFIAVYNKKIEENKNRSVRPVTDFVSLVGRKT